MSEKRRKKSGCLRPFVYCVLSFFLAVILFLLSICVSLRVTFFSEDYMLQTMAEYEYYSQLTEEFRKQMVSLSHASGLTDDFTNDFVATLDFRQDVTEYVDAFYSGESTVIKTTAFKQQFRSALDKYVEKNKKAGTEVSESALEYLVNEAADIYSNTIEIPFFSVGANFIYKYNTTLNVVMIVLAVAGVVLGLIMFLTNEFRHRGYRYLSYAFSAAFICTMVPPVLVLCTGVIEKINITTRSLYNLFTHYFGGIFTYFIIFGVVYLVAGVLMFVMFANKHKKSLRGN